MVKKKNYFLFLISCLVFLLSACDWDKDNIMPPFSQTWKAPMEYDDSGATRFLNVAAVGFDVDLSPEINRDKIITLIDKVKLEQPDIRLILFPETTLGYCYRSSNLSEYVKSIAETIPGETTNLLSQKAIEHQIYISLGMVQKSGNDLFNSQVLISPDGTILSIHHKYYLTPIDEMSGFKAGNYPITLNVIDNIKVATIICHDVQSVAVNKEIDKSCAELVLYPVANTSNMPANLFPPYYKFTYTWHLSANRMGNEDGLDFDGFLFLSSPGGKLEKKSVYKEGYIYGEVKL